MADNKGQAALGFHFVKCAPPAMRGQAALDFLMTYGWALLLLALVAAAVLALGIMDPGSFIGNRAFGFSQVEPVGWNINGDGVLTVMFKNNAGSDINITSITGVWGLNTVTSGTVVPIAASKQSGVISAGSFAVQNRPGTSYSVKLTINYTDTESGFAYTDTGTLNGKVA